MSNLREELVKKIQALPESELEGVMDYVRLLDEPPEVEATEDERMAIARGREEFRKGECVSWRDIKTDAV
jgi:hypothetical protein